MKHPRHHPGLSQTYTTKALRETGVELSGQKATGPAIELQQKRNAAERHQPSREYLAKKWGNAHGYEGRVGGWIYKGGRAICQGWDTFYFRFQKPIEEDA